MKNLLIPVLGLLASCGATQVPTPVSDLSTLKHTQQGDVLLGMQSDSFFPEEEMIDLLVPIVDEDIFNSPAFQQWLFEEEIPVMYDYSEESEDGGYRLDSPHIVTDPRYVEMYPDWVPVAAAVAKVGIGAAVGVATCWDCNSADRWRAGVAGAGGALIGVSGTAVGAVLVRAGYRTAGEAYDVAKYGLAVVPVSAESYGRHVRSKRNR